VSAADRAIRVSATVAVLGVAGIAAYISYWHAYEVISAHGESGAQGFAAGYGCPQRQRSTRKATSSISPDLVTPDNGD